MHGEEAETGSGLPAVALTAFTGQAGRWQATRRRIA